MVSRGLKHTAFDQPTAQAALDRANRLLTPTDIRLVGAWTRPALPTAFPAPVPVYLVESKQDAAGTPAFVPRGCRCIFIDTAYLTAWVANNSRGAGRMMLDRGYFLTFVLLHEAGHIAKGTSAAAIENGIMTQLNIAPSVAKSNEEDADEFATQLLRRYATQTPANATTLDANWVVNELVKLSWNMQAYRSIDEFGAFSVGKPGVYFDNGYTHPNLAWRILRANDLIQKTAATRELLETFEDARQRGAAPKPLYQRAR